MNWFTSLPQWFQMIVIFLIIGGITYRLIRHGIKIKAGSVEIDADNSESEKISSEKDSTSGEGK